MTKEEAIKGLKVLRRDFSGYKPNEEMYDMAIKALEQEPCDDCISRKAAIDEVEYELEMINSALDSLTLDFNARERLRQRRGEAREILNSIQQFPSVTPQSKMGRWIGHREHCENLGVMPSGLGAYEWCSNCDCGIDVREWHRNHYNYCPNCGAKMIEPQEGEE